MNLQAEKIELAKLLLSTKNPKIIQSIRNLFKKEKVVDFWDEIDSKKIYILTIFDTRQHPNKLDKDLK